MAFRSGFVSIIGKPNAGKSTLLNALVGEKVAIVTRKPQTTRNRILGMVNVERKTGHSAGQIVLIDTPGIHKPINSLNRRMMQEVYDALEGCNLLLLIVDATAKFGPGDEAALNLAKKTGLPIFLLLNKVDAIEKQKLLPLIARYKELHDFAEVIPISALKKQALDTLLAAVIKALPEGPRYFPKDQLTDQPERFLAAEIIREKAILTSKDEVPHAIAVLVDGFEEKPKLIRIRATIYVEREGQKGILIGAGGATIKKIGTDARQELESILGAHIFLELFVKVQPNWRQNEALVRQLDWRRQLEQLSTE